MRRFLNLVGLLALVAILVYGLGSPRIALAAVERAAGADDVVALAYHLDLVSIRNGLQAGFIPHASSAQLSTSASPLEQMATALSQALEGAVGTLVGGTVVDLIGSSEGILQLLGGVPLRPLLGAAVGRNRVPETFARATTGYEWPVAFVMRVPALAGDGVTEFVLRPRGWVWKITEVRWLTGS